MAEIKHSNDAKGGKFEIFEGEKKAGLMTYTWSGDEKFIITHTEVNSNFNGKGYGKKLVEAVVNFARENGKKIIPTCSFAKSAIQKEAEWQDVL